MRPINFGYWKEENGQRVFVTTSEHALEVQNKVAEKLALIAYLLQQCGCGIVSAVNLPELGVSAYQVASEIAVRAWRLSEKVGKEKVLVVHYKMRDLYDQLGHINVPHVIDFAVDYCKYGMYIKGNSHINIMPFSCPKRQDALYTYISMLPSIAQAIWDEKSWDIIGGPENDAKYIMPYDPLRNRFVIAPGLPTSPYIAGLLFAYKIYSHFAHFANDIMNESCILYNAVHVPGVSVIKSLGYAQRTWACGDYGKTCWSEISRLHCLHYGQEAVLIRERDISHVPLFHDSFLNFDKHEYSYGDSFSFYGNEITVGNPEVRGDNSPVLMSAHAEKAKTLLRTFAMIGD
jgi:hypothetical protein